MRLARILTLSVSIAIVLVLMVAVAQAQLYPTGVPPQVSPTTLTQPAPPPTDVLGDQVTRQLPVTGGDVAGMALLAVLLIGVGVVLRRRGMAVRPTGSTAP